MSIISQTKSFTLKLFTFLSTFLYFCIGIFGICTGFTFIVFFNTRFYSIFSSIFSSKFLITAPQNVTAAEPLAPTITISEIMSCPLTGGKEWIELSRDKVSLPNQVQLSQDYSLTGYRLEDDKSTIWTGNATTPVTFVQNQEMTQIELNKQYLNNTGDSLKLWSPSGELLDQAIIPACKESGYSWSFQDGEWLSGIPSPGEQNPTIPIPTPTPTPSPTPTASPTPSVTPTPATSPLPSVSPTPTPAGTPSPSFTTQPSVSPVLSSATSAQSAEATQTSGSKNELKSSVIDPTYLQRIFLTTDRDENNTTISATIADTSTKVGAVLGTNKIPDEHSELDREISPESDSNKIVQPTIYHSPLPERSPSTYISAILGGVLLTSSGGIHTLHTQHRNGKQNKQTKHSY